MKQYTTSIGQVICFGKYNGHMKDKFNRVAKLASHFDELNRKFDSYIDGVKKPTERSVAALACKIMAHTGIRIGNEESAKGYQSTIDNLYRETFGLTTLKRKHVKVKDGKVYLSFIGKRGIGQKICISDKKLSNQIKRYLTLMNSQYLIPIHDNTVRRFVTRSVGKGFVPKDFRTLYANVVATEQMIRVSKQYEFPVKRGVAKKHMTELVTKVAESLGNTPNICRRSYLDKRLVDQYIAQALVGRPLCKIGSMKPLSKAS
jgi:DNA topoisomerase-1